MKILVVCHGNVCRSPSAEKILRKMYPDLVVRSAGLKFDSSGGRLIAKKTRTALENLGYETSGRSVLVTDEMMSDADLILHMGPSNLDKITHKFGATTARKCVSIGELIGRSSIPDPNFSPLEKHVEMVRMLETAFSSDVFRQMVSV
jgi:protein-tyrosine phosphatase